MKISVITAIRNGRADIARTMDSVAVQNYPSLEYIVIDGASTDGTLDYLKSRRDEITSLQSEPDRGIYDAFNKGLALASGDIIGYLNAGDVLADPGVLAQIAAPFKDPEIQAVFGDVAIVSDTNSNRLVRLYRSSNFSPGRVRFGFMPAHPTLYLRRSVYATVGGYDPSFRIAGDYELVIRTFVKRQTRYCYLRQTLVRMPVGGVSNRGIRSKIQITAEMKRACRQNGVSTSSFLLSLRYPVKMLELIRHSH